MKEKEIQRAVADFLNQANITYTHVANEGKSLSVVKSKIGDNAYFSILEELKQQGVKKGVPDVLIFESPPNFADKKGLALELKTKSGRLTEPQEKWLHKLTEIGWLCAYTEGLDQAWNVLEKAGYK